ncbi:MAG: DEAD/DEAH box helicase [Planctomycetota bacterium]
MSLEIFHPIVQAWFRDRFGTPTEPQLAGWPAIASGQHTLIAAPTGSGKTLAAFLVCLDQLLRQQLAGELPTGTQVIYISPLKALSNDIERNLQQPLEELGKRVELAGYPPLAIRTGVRTGDTPPAERQRMLRQPPHILVTTPESLYLLLTSPKARAQLQGARTVIVDEIHALARDKRGSHLTLTLERLARLCEQPLVRIGLSATQRPMDRIAAFLVGHAAPNAPPQPCQIVDVGHARQLDLALDVPPRELEAVCSHEQWGEVYKRLVQLIETHRSTVIFVNTRRLAERVSHHLTELLGAEAVASHHGSLSREIRLSAERRLKEGSLRAIVATASLEMGLDIGYIDLVCQIGSPRSIATLLQRVGRSGHSLGLIPKGRLFPLTRDELIESLALIRAVRRGALDAIEIPTAPLDILAQQIVAMVSCEEWEEEKLWQVCQGAWPYRDLRREDFGAVVQLLSEGLTSTTRAGALLHRDQIQGRVRARRGARLTALTSGGAIPEAPLYRVVTESERTFVGTVDEHFAIDSSAGDIFLLGTTSWRIAAVRGGEVLVNDAQGAPPTVPFWFGESSGRTVELSAEVSALRQWLADHVEQPTVAVQELIEQCGADEWAAEQAVRYVRAQHAALGTVPTGQEIVFERFFDESGGMQLVIHSPYGHRINRAWGLALRKRFCRSFDFELQAAATDNGILLSVGPQHSFPIEQLFQMLTPANGRELLEQAVLAQPIFPLRWRWNISRALAVPRFQSGQKVPFHIQRFRSDDLLAAVFPATVGCLENHHGDIEIPDHVLVRQTMDDCLHEALDVDRWLDVLRARQAGQVNFSAYDTREPSPFSHELINANPYAFLDGADLEERRTRAVSTRRTLAPDDLRDLSRLDPVAIEQVVAEAWPVVRSADELHDALYQAVLLREHECREWSGWLQELADQGRAAQIGLSDLDRFWIAAERWPIARVLFPAAACEPALQLPPSLERTYEAHEAWAEVLRGRVPLVGPATTQTLATLTGLDVDHAQVALEKLEADGLVLRGRFLESDAPVDLGDQELVPTKTANLQWCDRRLLARIHRLTLDGLRRRISPVTPSDFWRFLQRHQRLGTGHPASVQGVRDALAQLEGCELPGGAWEQLVLAPRVASYEPRWLDELFLAGEVTWGRLRPPRRDETDEPGFAALTRTMPISLTLREHLPWLLPTDREEWPVEAATQPAQAVRQLLHECGALFLPEIKMSTRLELPQVEESLRELAAVGLASSDSFAAVRSLVAATSATAPPITATGPLATATGSGRWSLYPGPLARRLAGELQKQDEQSRSAASNAMTVPTRLERWCWLLLRRWGVIFRDLALRETAAPPWRELVPLLRRLELRGEIRGGRFITGVSGEQFATELAVQQLRQVRDEVDADWQLLSAADPLNLFAEIIPGPSIPATHKNAVIVWHGRCIAARRGGKIEFFEEVDAATREAMTVALNHLRRLAKPDSTTTPTTSRPLSIRNRWATF